MKLNTELYALPRQHNPVVSCSTEITVGSLRHKGTTPGKNHSSIFQWGKLQKHYRYMLHYLKWNKPKWNTVQSYWRSTTGVSQHLSWDGAENRTDLVSLLCSLAPSDQRFLAHSPKSKLALSAPEVLLRKLINLPEFTALGQVMQSSEVALRCLAGCWDGARANEPSQFCGGTVNCLWNTHPRTHGSL